MANTVVDVGLIITLPATVSTQAETLDITNFTVEGTAVTHNFIDTNRFNAKYGADGTAEIFQNPNGAKFIEFVIVPLSEIDIKLTKFAYANSASPIVVQMKDRNYDFSIFSEQAYFNDNPDSINGSDPDYKTFRILVPTYIES